MGSAEPQGVLFAHCQEWRSLASKRLDMGSAFVQEGRFTDTQEWRY